MWTTAAAIVALGSLVPVGLAGLFDSPRPLIAFAYPKGLLGLDDGFSKRIDQVAFLPGFHACGTMTILALDADADKPSSAPSLDSTDFDLFPHTPHATNGSTSEPPVKKFVMDYLNEAPDSVLEGNALEGTVLSWARGWSKTCGRGAANKQVIVVRLSTRDVLDAGRDGRKEYVEALDARIVPYLEKLEPAPHNNLVIISPISSTTLRLLFDTATSPPGRGKDTTGGTPGWRIEFPDRSQRRARRSWLARIFARLIDGAILLAAVVGVFSAGRWALRKYRTGRDEGKIRLPFTTPPASANSEERELDLEAE
ncbi:uncharacterized protein JCM15063_000422 [Sporobolomyces koalae]|uniref:uncharacterized protein n=1 Tax=Sporobolomyces koalae TaxID=500713 RepID=UPI00317969B4